MVVRFDTDGRVRQVWTFPRAESGQDFKPGTVSTFHGIAVAANGDLYLAEINGRRVQKFARIESNVPLTSLSSK
jgi:hypothetical protein